MFVSFVLVMFHRQTQPPNLPDSIRSSPLFCVPTRCAAPPFLSGLPPLRSPLPLLSPGVQGGALGFNFMLPPELVRHEIHGPHDHGISVSRSQGHRRVEAWARVCAVVGWSLRGSIPLADLGLSQQLQIPASSKTRYHASKRRLD